MVLLKEAERQSEEANQGNSGNDIPGSGMKNNAVGAGNTMQGDTVTYVNEGT